MTGDRSSGMNEKVNILVSGWFGCGNIGDDAILEGIVATARSLEEPPGIAALSHDPEGTASTLGIRAYPHLPAGFRRGARSAADGALFRTIGAFRRSDLFLLGGGGFLSDWQEEAPWVWLRQLLLAKAMGKKTMLYGLGAGPFLTKKGSRLTRRLVDQYADRITVRDERSRRWLLDIGCKKEITVTGDPALVLKENEGAGPALLKTMGIPDVPLVGLNGIPLFLPKAWGSRMDRYDILIERLVEIARHVIEYLGLHLLGIPFMEMDRDVLAAVASAAGREKFKILGRGIPPRDLLSVIGSLEAMIGMRYHSLLFSAMTATPFYGIVYHHKGDELVRAMEMGPFSQEVGDGALMEDRDLDAEKVKEGIGYLLSHRDEIRVGLRSRGKRLRKREANNGEILKKTVEEVGAEV